MVVAMETGEFRLRSVHFGDEDYLEMELSSSPSSSSMAASAKNRAAAAAGGSHTQTQSQDFEFSVCASSSSSSSSSCSSSVQQQQQQKYGNGSESGSGSGYGYGDISPADDLFYKGRLLPLCLPPRLQMMSTLSLLDLDDEQQVQIQKQQQQSSSGMDFDLDLDLDSAQWHHEVHSSNTIQQEQQQPLLKLKLKMKMKMKMPFSIFRSRTGSSKNSSSDYSNNKTKVYGMDYSDNEQQQEPKFLVKFRSMRLPQLPVPVSLALFCRAKLRGNGLDMSVSSGGGVNGGHGSRSRKCARNTIQKYYRMVKHSIRVRSEETQAHAHETEVAEWTTSLKSAPSSPIVASFCYDDIDVAIEGAIAHCKKCNSFTSSSSSSGMYEHNV